MPAAVWASAVDHQSLATCESGAAFFDSDRYGHVQYSLDTNWVRIDRAAYAQLLDLILDNAIISVGGDLFRQIVGIPMGFNDSPYMAQTFFDYLDYLFVDKAVKEQDWEKALQLSHMHRVADDVLCFNCPDFMKVMRTSWGSITTSDFSGTTHTHSAWQHISLNDETTYKPDGTNSVDMCDCTITFSQHGKIRFQLYDKLRHMKGFSRE